MDGSDRLALVLQQKSLYLNILACALADEQNPGGGVHLSTIMKLLDTGCSRFSEASRLHGVW